LPVSWSRRFDRREPREYVPVEPLLVVEISVDEAYEPGRWRHPVKLVRLRGDLRPQDVPRRDGEHARRLSSPAPGFQRDNDGP
jgi:hypothetical protein